MENPLYKLNCLSEKGNLFKENENRNKKYEYKLNPITMCDNSIRELEKIRIKKQNLERVGDSSRQLSVWDRLSKGQSSISPGGKVIGNPYRHDMCFKTNSPTIKPLNVPTYDRRQKKTVFQKVSLPKQTKNQDHALCIDSSLTEVFTATNFKASKSSLDDKTPTGIGKTAVVIDKDVEIETSENDLNEIFESATLFPSLSNDSITCSARIALDFRSALENRRCFMAPEEISMIKDAIKSDKRLQVKGVNDKIFVDVLRSTLRKVTKQEHVLKLALQNLSTKEQKILCSFEKSLQQQSNLPRNPHVHVIFKDIPNMQKKDLIFNTLKNNITKTLMGLKNKKNITTKSACTITTDIQFARKIYYVSSIGQYAVGRVRVQGVCLYISFVREFRIARRTITELKNDKRLFYLPVNDKHTELKRTSFKRLKENPQLLMSFMHPKDSIVPFNVLEQDSIFFNSFFYKSFCGTSSNEQSSDDDENLVICESNEINKYLRYQRSVDKFPLKIEEISSSDPQRSAQDRRYSKPTYKANTSDTVGDIFTDEKKTTKISAEKCEIPKDNKVKVHLNDNCHKKKSIGTKARAKRRTTPLPERKSICPKNRLIPFICVAVAELSLFFVLILSHFYSHITC